jgi:UDP-2,3-diacylglucosamine pyrophosphatase LpxH
MDVLSSKTDVVDRDVLLEANELECSTVLHGHTHRPSDRLLHTDAKRDVRKVVLGDWDEVDEVDEADGAQERAVSCARYQDGVLTTFLV